MEVVNNLGKEFFKILKRNFPSGSQLYKIFNKNCIKLSYRKLKKCRKYRAGNRTCNLRMEEKLIIADCKSKNMLNKRSEVLNKKHKRAWLLNN